MGDNAGPADDSLRRHVSTEELDAVEVPDSARATFRSIHTTPAIVLLLLLEVQYVVCCLGGFVVSSSQGYRKPVYSSLVYLN